MADTTVYYEITQTDTTASTTDYRTVVALPRDHGKTIALEEYSLNISKELEKQTSKEKKLEKERKKIEKWKKKMRSFEKR